MKINNFKKKLICVGAGDQFEAIKPIIEGLGSRIDFLIDDTPGKLSPYDDIELVGTRKNFDQWFHGRNAEDFGFVVAIGNPYGKQRKIISDWLRHFGLEPISFADPSSYIEKNARFELGLQVMKFSMLSTLTRVGEQCIINTKSLVEHHCELGDGVEIGPNATLCGRVVVKNFTWIGAGTIVLPRLNIQENNIIGAGSVVTKNIEESNSVWIGNPLRKLRDNFAK